MHWPIEQPKAVVGLIHGFTEHTGRYIHVAEFLNENGFAVAAYDLPGHGNTPGKRGHVDTYDALLDSVQTLLDFIRAQYPDAPVFLFGHSIGGNILANFLIRRKPDIQGAVLQGSWLRMPREPSKVKVGLARLMRNIYPAMQISAKEDMIPETMSRDPAVVAAYRTDPLNHGKITPTWFFSTLEAQSYALTHAAEISVPTLVMHGTDDQAAPSSGSEDLVRNGGKNLTLKLWPGLYHGLHDEPEKHEVMQYMVDWMTGQLEPN